MHNKYLARAGIDSRSLLIHGSSTPPGQGLEIWDEEAQALLLICIAAALSQPSAELCPPVERSFWQCHGPGLSLSQREDDFTGEKLQESSAVKGPAAGWRLF